MSEGKISLWAWQWPNFSRIRINFLLWISIPKIYSWEILSPRNLCCDILDTWIYLLMVNLKSLQCQLVFVTTMLDKAYEIEVFVNTMVSRLPPHPTLNCHVLQILEFVMKGTRFLDKNGVTLSAIWIFTHYIIYGVTLKEVIICKLF